MRDALAFAAAAILLAGCMYPKSAEPPASLTAAEVDKARAKDPAADAAAVGAGRDLFVAKCGECHDHPDVMAIEDARWPGILEEMGEKAEIDAAQRAGVLRFILAVRAARAPAK